MIGRPADQSRNVGGRRCASGPEGRRDKARGFNPWLAPPPPTEVPEGRRETAAAATHPVLHNRPRLADASPQGGLPLAQGVNPGKRRRTHLHFSRHAMPTHDNPGQPTTTHANPCQPTTTHDNPSSSRRGWRGACRAARAIPRQPRAHALGYRECRPTGWRRGPPATLPHPIRTPFRAPRSERFSGGDPCLASSESCSASPPPAFLSVRRPPRPSCCAFRTSTRTRSSSPTPAICGPPPPRAGRRAASRRIRGSSCSPSSRRTASGSPSPASTTATSRST